MEWLVSLFAAFLGWWIGHLQGAEQRRRGVAEGAQAAFFGIEHGLNPSSPVFPSDRAVQPSTFENIAMDDPESVRKAALSAGEAYSNIIRRDAFEDCRRSNFTEADRAEWARAFGKEMPPVSYGQGYLQAIKDVMSGATDEARKYLQADAVTQMADWVDKSQRKFAGEPAYIYLEQFNADGKLLGAELVSQTVVHTFRRAEAQQRGSEGS